MENKEVPTRFPWKASPKNGRILIDAAGEKVLTVNYGTGTAPFQVAKFTESACNALAAGISDPVAFMEKHNRLVDAATCAANVLFLLTPEIGRMACSAKNVGPNLRAAIEALQTARTFTKES